MGARSRTEYVRLLKLHDYLHSRTRYSKKDLSEKLEVSDKTIQRDLDYLRDQLGAPLEYNRAENYYYYENPSWHLPLFNLGENELLAYLMVSAVGDADRRTVVAQKTIKEMTRSLCESLQIEPDVLKAQFSVNRPSVMPIASDVWKSVMNALLLRRMLVVDYSIPSQSTCIKRTIEPYHLTNSRGEWYVLGFCHEKEKVQTFSVGRMSSADLQDDKFILPEDFVAEDWIRNSFGSHFTNDDSGEEFVLHFDKKVADRIRTMTWHHSQVTKTLPDGRTEVRFRAVGLEGVKRWLLAWGDQVTVVEPAELRKRVRREVEGMMQRYCDDWQMPISDSAKEWEETEGVHPILSKDWKNP